MSDEGGRGDDLMSPAIQLTAIRDYCDRRGYVITEVLEDIDLTGRFWKRRQVEQAIAMIEAGAADVIVVWKVSRVSRNRKDWAVAVDRVDVAGGRMESATEGYDATTSSGRLTRGMLAELAAYESELIGDNWRSVHQQRIARGLPHYAPPRFGYDYSRAEGYQPNADADVVREMYRRYIGGEGVGGITMWLRAEGIMQPKTGRRWTRYGVQYFLDSGFAAGLIQVHDSACRCRSKSACSNRVRRPGSHEAVLSGELWQDYLAARNARRGTRWRGETSRLAGVVICAGCDRPMQLQGSSGKPRHAFVCRTNRLGSVECAAPAWVRRERVERVVREWLPSVAEEVEEEIDRLPPVSVTETRQETLRRKLGELDDAMGRLAASNAVTPIPEAAYQRAVGELIADRSAVERELRALTPPDLSGVAEAVAGLIELWDADGAVNPVVRQLIRVHVERGGAMDVAGVWQRG